ncbi:MAG: hypothetical protein ABR549_02390 [Mycobacteriales bacterium]
MTDYERAFREAGLPSFIADRTAGQDVWRRALPLMGLVFFLEVLGAVDLNLSFAANLALILAAVALLLGAVGLSNRARRRPLFSAPSDAGRVELVGFVVLPALVPLLLNLQPISALVTAGSNLALLVLLYAVFGYGLPSIVTWAARRFLGQLSTAAQLIARAIPLLMLFSVVLFFTADMWQVFAELSVARVAAVVGLLGLLAVAFIVVRLPREVAVLQEGLPEAPALDRRERVNVGLVLLVSQGLQVLVVAVAVGLFFVALGLLSVSRALVHTWIGTDPHVLLGNGEFVVTEELLRVASAIAAFSGFYYAIAVLTDPTYRAEFAEEITDEMRQSFEDRVAYLKGRG